MRKKIYGLLVLALVVALAVIPVSTMGAFAMEGETEQKILCNAIFEDDFSKDRVMVLMKNSESLKFKKYKPSDFSEIGCASVEDLSTAAAKDIKEHKNHVCDIGAKVGGYHQILSLELKDKSKENVLKAMEKLEKRNDVFCAEPDYKISLCDEIIENSDEPAISKAIINPGQPFNPPYPDPVAVNDPYYTDGLQWALDKMKLPQAWNLTTGSDDIVVGVIDSGIDYTHPDLAGKIDTSKSYDFEKNTSAMPNLSTLHWHGTFVAGIIGASVNNGYGMAGACPNVKMASLRVLDEKCEGFGYNTAYAIDYARAKGIQIINISKGSYIYSEIKEQAIFNYNGLIICSAGNEDNDNDSEKKHYLSCYSNLDNVISVGASNQSDNRAKEDTFASNYGKNSVSLFAPGVGILSAYLDKNYGIDGGTSFAAPYVTGVATLLKAKYPSITPAEIKTAIIKGVDKVGGLSNLCVSGGRLNAYRALIYASHDHSYTYRHQFISASQHRSYCSCMHFYTESPHWAYASSIYTKNGHKYATCAICKVDINIDNNPIITLSDSYSVEDLKNMGLKVITNYEQLVSEIASPNLYLSNILLKNFDSVVFDNYMIVIGEDAENLSEKICEAVSNFKHDIDGEAELVYNKYNQCEEVWL